MFAYIKVLRIHIFAVLIAGILGWVGCGSDEYSGPVALPDDDLPTAIRAAFLEAPAATKDMAEKAVTFFEEEEYDQSYAQFRKICDLRELTDERRQIASRCLITLTAKIREAAEEKDDKSAEKVLRYNQFNK